MITHRNQWRKHPDTEAAFPAVHKIIYRPDSPAVNKERAIREIFHFCASCTDDTDGCVIIIRKSGIDNMCFCLRNQCGGTSPLHGALRCGSLQATMNNRW